jgi:hypothetical protein
MIPTTLIGLVLLVLAVQYARQPDRRRLQVLRHLNVLVGLSALLGFVAGTIKTLVHMPPDQLYIAYYGVGESLNNIGLGIGMLALARIIMAVGASRDTDDAAHLLDPRAP